MTARVRNVPTWRMRRDELARVWAEHHGLVTSSNAITTRDGVCIAQGWDVLGEVLEAIGVVEVGRGISWNRDHGTAAARAAWLGYRRASRRRAS